MTSFYASSHCTIVRTELQNGYAWAHQSGAYLYAWLLIVNQASLPVSAQLIIQVLIIAGIGNEQANALCKLTLAGLGGVICTSFALLRLCVL